MVLYLKVDNERSNKFQNLHDVIQDTNVQIKKWCDMRKTRSTCNCTLFYIFDDYE